MKRSGVGEIADRAGQVGSTISGPLQRLCLRSARASASPGWPLLQAVECDSRILQHGKFGERNIPPLIDPDTGWLGRMPPDHTRPTRSFVFAPEPVVPGL